MIIKKKINNYKEIYKELKNKFEDLKNNINKNKK